MRRTMNRAIATTTMLAMAASPLGCGYLLYPERRGTQSGTIDSGTIPFFSLYSAWVLRLRAVSSIAFFIESVTLSP